ncbi:hypothetical protein ACFPAF_00040 [Hymenobacter endophyticus]|uniref:DUF4468 domain-containing protein n=1 Tax=Hymenobacter endophyticus TaxID=3076335 RepID=A0ABU3TBM7_9BACT|nr:hypothetical protein [Hymenobacter endophyticus]MDU0368766.1 hypothetical protein [Hymenobacter endophyticus]
MLPVSPATQRVAYHDTVQVPGASVEQLRNALYNTFFRNFAFTDYTYTASGPVASIQPREPAAPGETVTLGTITMFKPGEQAVFVAGITPPEALEQQPPFNLVHFTLRARFEPGVAYLTLTDFYQRTTTMKQEMTRQLAMVGTLSKSDPALAQLPASTPVETLYAAWLPGSKPTPAAPAVAPTPVKPPTQTEAQRLAEHAQNVLKALRYAMFR